MFILPSGNDPEMIFIALFLEGFLCGLYSGIIAIYLQYHSSKKDTNKTEKILFYSICTLYVLSASLFVCDVVFCMSELPFMNANLNIFSILIVQTTLFACCDLIAQFILIYRCWIVWGRNIRIVIIPSMIAVTFFVIWLLGLSGGSALEGPVAYTRWRPNSMTPMALALSSTVNALVTGLIVFKIFKVCREVKAISDDKTLSATGGSKLWCIILVIIESAMGLFSVQLARLVVSIVRTEDASRVYNMIVTAHQMLNGITPTIILVRISMGLSFHDEKSMEESAIESLRFASNHHSSVPDMGSIGIVSQGSRDTDAITVRRGNDIDIIER